MLSFKTQTFEGPLELLLQLINKNRVSIYDIPISLITKQFIEEIDKMEGEPEKISEFIVMAATLISIKAKMLLFGKEEKTEQPDPRAELVKKLEKYKNFKDITEEFKKRDEKSGERIFGREDKKIMNKIRASAPANMNQLLEGITPEYLFEIFESLMEKAENKKDKIRSEFKLIKKSAYDIRDKMQYVKDIIFTEKHFSFSKILRDDSPKDEIIVTFLAVLELAKEKSISIRQQESEIYVEGNEAYGKEGA